ncbi:MAG: RsmB/NOP family class I SAM-dependent RNA methyltransferase [Deltaproteobacteria bacterium]|nr:RsmB/NOP family class I SAM-dependent RNA methyltransferase [Deltaproteobacteria bacterium]
MDARLKSFPADFIKRIQNIFPAGLHQSIFKAFLEKRPISFRVNTIKNTEEAALTFLEKNKIHFQKDRQIPLCYYFKDTSLKKIRELSLYQNGGIYLQNASSQVVPWVLGPLPGENILDLCASPGSKTTQISALMKNSGSITALEPDAIRYERLLSNCKLLGANNVHCIKARGEVFYKKYLNPTSEPCPVALFDKVLVDAPCSGEGTFYINDKASFAHWSLLFVKEMAALQKKLLHAAIQVCKPGGHILYSTCSLAPEENEKIVYDALLSQPNIKCVPMTPAFPFFKPAISQWDNVNFTGVAWARRIYPTNTTQGFFMALLKKN